MDIRCIAEHLADAAAAFPFLGIARPEQLLEAVRGELGSESAFEQWQSTGGAKVKAVAPASILHVLSGNTPAAGLQTLLRGLLIGTRENRCKIPSAGLPEIAAFCERLPAELSSRVTISSELPDEWLETSEIVVVFGSDDTLAHFRRIVPAHVRLIGYGHKVSVGMLFEPAPAEVAAAAAMDVALFDQQGCLSPHVFYVREQPEAFAAALARELDLLATKMPRAGLDLSGHARIRQMREEYAFAAASGEEVRLWQSAGGTDWTVIYTANPDFTASCLNRVVFVKPFPNNLDRWQIAHLSTVGIWPVSEGNTEVALACGATRVCPVGRMQQPPFTWHQDGVPALGSLVRWVDFESQ